MIHKKRFLRVCALAFALPVMLLSSCSNDELEGSEPGGRNDKSEIRFEIGFAPQNGTAYAEGLQSRAATDNQFNTTWEEGDAIGLFAVSRASGATGGAAQLKASGNYIHNVKLTYNSSTQQWTPSETLYFDGTNVLDFYAYHPYDDNSGSPQTLDPRAITFNVKPDQNTTTNIGTDKSNYNLSDLLTAKSDNSGNGYAKADFKGVPIPITFSHALSLVQVEVPVQGKGYGPSENLVVRLRGVKAGATLDLSAASGTPGSGVSLSTANNDAQNIIMHRVEQQTDANYTTSYTYRALVPAQTVAAGASLFWFDHEDRQLISSNVQSAPLKMTAGKTERYEIPLPQAVHTVSIPAGTFLMGSSDGTNIGNGNGSGLNTTPAEPNRNNNETQHKVTLTKDFYMSKYQVTNAQFAAFLNAKGVHGETLTHPYGYGDMTGGKCTWGANDGQHLVYEGQSGNQWGVKWENNEWVPQDGYANHPVIWVTWYGATEYAAWAGGSLPTEAQWEYACRGGKENHPFGIGSGYDLNNTHANFWWTYSWEWDGSSADADITNIDGYPASTQIVGSYSQNSYGLYDMHGNVWEWCSDRYAMNYGSANAADPVTNPTGSDSGSNRVLRGGSWPYSAQYCRSAYRFNYYPDPAYGSYGFRVVFVP